MNEYEQEVVTQLNDSAAKAVKGSEYGIDEHVFGIAAQMIEEKDKLIADSIPKSEILAAIKANKELAEIYRSDGAKSTAWACERTAIDLSALLTKDKEEGQ